MDEIRARVKHALEGLDIADPKVTFPEEYQYKMLVQLISPSFETIDDYDRQLMVWDKLVEELGENVAWERIGFVFTDSPSEVEGRLAEAANDLPS